MFADFDATNTWNHAMNDVISGQYRTQTAFFLDKSIVLNPYEPWLEELQTKNLEKNDALPKIDVWPRGYPYDGNVDAPRKEKVTLLRQQFEMYSTIYRNSFPNF